ncbi:MAG: Ig-like domain-containing protein [Gemmatimonas sp.]
MINRFARPIVHALRASAPLRLLHLAPFLALGACGGGKGPTENPAPVPAAVSTLSGDGQSAAVGTPLAASLIVRVTTSSGIPVSGKTVTFTVSSGTATLTPASAVTDNTGSAGTSVTMGIAPGAVTVDASVTGTSLTTRFTVTATTTAVSCTSPLTLAVGAATTVSGTSVCVSGGAAGGDYALIPFNGSTSGSTRSTFTVSPAGIRASVALSAEASASVSAGASMSARQAIAALGASGSLTDGRAAFEAGLRRSERTLLNGRFAEARTWLSSRSANGGARFTMIPSTAPIGSLHTLNANASQGCTNPKLRAARVVAVGRKAMILADTLNPAGGFTDADYASIAATFDDVVDGVNTNAFGEPTDIDGNGHVILFFTSAVNELTPVNSSFYVGGFFYGRDLFPTTTNATAQGCATSNVAEMFYLMVPDPTGSINGNTRTKTFVTNATIATVAHEYEHLINASRRMYVNSEATSFEETWLDEGLAHIAEELLFYRRSGLGPLANISASTLRSNETYRLSFNSDAISNFGRFESYIENPSPNSPYASNDSLATRGAAWAFLRYATDQQSFSQETILRALVNSGTTGLNNIRNVFGTDYMALFRDWTTSIMLDDVSGSTVRYSFRSWNIPSVSGALTESGSYPLLTQSLVSGTNTSVSIAGGSAAYLRFGVAAGGNGTFSWTGPMQVTVVRLR